MAFPQISDIVNFRETSNANVHSIIFLANLQEDEFVFGIIAGYYTGTISENDDSGNFYVSNTYSGTGNVRLCFFCGKAIGGIQDFLIVNTVQSCKLSFIFYRITGHGAENEFDLDGEWNWGSTLGFITPQCPDPDDSISDDYLWFNFVAYDGVCSVLNAPSGFSNVIHNTRNGSDEVSIASSERQYTGSMIGSSTWTNVPSAFPYITNTVRIPSGSYALSDPGFGIIRPSGMITGTI
jgi:hypothetical protein